MLFDEGEVENAGDGLENLGIEVEVAAITIGQNVPFFEACKSMFDNNSAACKFGVSFLLGSRQRAVFRFLFRENYTSRMFILKALIARIRQNRNSRQRPFRFANFEIMNTSLIRLRYA